MGGMLDPKRRGDDPTIRQSKSALLEATQAAVEARKKAPASPIAPTGSRRRFRMLLLIAVVGGTVLVAQPHWLVGRVPAPETNDIRYASATLVLIEAIGQVRAYATTKGQLPSLPSEAGVTNPAVTLKPLQGGEFELGMQVGDFRIAVRSTDALKPLIVRAVQSLTRRAG